MSKKTLILLIIAILILGGAVGFWLYSKEYASKDTQKNKEIADSQSPQNESTIQTTKDFITEDFEISSRSAFGKKVTYGCYIGNDFSKMIEVNEKDFNLPSNLYDFQGDIYLRLTYNPETLEVSECKVVNRENDEIIEDISEENMMKLFSVEYGKTPISMDWTDKIVLSNLKEGEIYKFTAPEDAEEFPTIENDTKKNCIVYLNEPDVFGDETATYEKEIYMGESISGNEASFSYKSAEANATYKIMYQEIDTEALLKKIDSDEIVGLSENTGDELSYEFEKYIYNDTDSDITITTYDSAFGVDDTNTYVLKAGEIYEFDWMVDSIKIN